LEFHENDEQCVLAFAPDKWGELEYVQVGFDFVGKNTLDFDADGAFSFKINCNDVADNCAETAAAFASPDEDCCPLACIAKKSFGSRWQK